MVRVWSAKGREGAHRGCNRSFMVTLQGHMSSIAYLMVTSTWRRGNVTAHREFFKSL